MSKAKKALVLQGGAMRGAYSAGVIKALQDLRLLEDIDYVVGTSAGASNGLLAATQTAEDGLSIYTNFMMSREVFNPFRRRDKINLSALKSKFRQNAPLRDLEIASNKTELLIGLTNPDTGEELFVSSKDKSVDILDALACSSSLPKLVDRLSSVQGKEYIDGGWSNLLPYDIAKQKGATDIIVVLTQPLNTKPGLFKKLSTKLIMSGGKSGKGDFIKKAGAKKKLTMEEIGIDIDRSDMNVNVIAPEPNAPAMPRITFSKRKVERIYNYGYDQTMRLSTDTYSTGSAGGELATA